MRLRLRGPTGTTVITLDTSSSTVGDLRSKITEATSVTRPDVKIGYPPKPLSLGEDSTLLSELNVKLDGEQLTVSQSSGVNGSENHHAKPKEPEPQSSIQASTNGSNPSSFSFADVGRAPPKTSLTAGSTKPSTPLSLTRKARTVSTEPPEVPLPSHDSTLLLRIMPDDNSCLFRAFSSAFFGAMDMMQELRLVIAQTIQAQPDKYPAVVLERNPDDYCRWIQSPDSWGGFIELEILSNYFDIEVCSIDVQTLRVDRFSEGSSQRCILVYSGIHYDVIARSPSDPPHDKAYAPPDFDVKLFDSREEIVLEAALGLCKILQGQHYFTDTAKFSIKCNVCGHACIGEKGATEHAAATGHHDFGEAG